MPAVDVEEVIRLAVASGISRDAFPSDWEGHELALYQDFTGRGTSEELARRLHEEKRSRGDWILDLGSKALLLSKAKDNTGSCAIGPFIRLFDDSFTLDDVRKAVVELRVTGTDNFVLDGSSSMKK